MATRISLVANYQSLITRMFENQQNVSKLREALAQGKMVTHQADDPEAWPKIMEFNWKIGQNERWLKNIEYGEGWNRYTEGVLNHMNELITKAREIAIKAIKLNSPETIQSYVKELDEIFDEFLGTANSKYENRFVLAPSVMNETTLFDNSTGAFKVDMDNSGVVDSTDVDLAFNKPLKIRIGPDEVTGLMRINIDAKALLYDENGDNILQNIKELRNAIANMLSGGTGAVETAMGKIEKAQDRILTALTQVGAHLNRLEARKNIIQAISVDYKDRVATLEKSDVAKLATDYQMAVTTLQAIYQTTASVSDLTLLRYV
ncbi:MAG: hypothetical protein JRI45_07720 [Deltaproteobacteria bacterium]|nr:hypothetical protein [Deltaproteobacteria bacterium]MBW2068283.1 hypothetical protein [Deltaproteobacteria bacterium]